MKQCQNKCHKLPSYEQSRAATVEKSVERNNYWVGGGRGTRDGVRIIVAVHRIKFHGFSDGLLYL